MPFDDLNAFSASAENPFPASASSFDDALTELLPDLVIFLLVRLPFETQPETEEFEESLTRDFLELLSRMTKLSPYLTVPTDFAKNPVPLLRATDLTETYTVAPVLKEAEKAKLAKIASEQKRQINFFITLSVYDKILRISSKISHHYDIMVEIHAEANSAD